MQYFRQAVAMVVTDEQRQRNEEFLNICIKDSLGNRLRRWTLLPCAPYDWNDDEHFYAAFTCIEPNVEAMSKRKTGVDTVVWHDDCVEVFISAGPDLFPYRQFEANAIDTRFDSNWFARKKMDGSWNATWNSRAAIGKDRWICEIAIPWRDIGSAPAPGDQRRGNLTRHRIPHEEETTTWTPMYKTFSDAEYMATWVFEAAGQR